jgi:hypothetical protein
MLNVRKIGIASILVLALSLLLLTSSAFAQSVKTDHKSNVQPATVTTSASQAVLPTFQASTAQQVAQPLRWGPDHHYYYHHHYYHHHYYHHYYHHHYYHHHYYHHHYYHHGR